jgi:peptidoglycan/LPS O-acetylase OafA/YrhL
MSLRTPEAQVDSRAGASGVIFPHFPQLDGFRGFAAILVLVGHDLQYSTVRFEAFGGRLAQLGVLLFFVLSGGLITGLLYRERSNLGGIQLGKFYVRRALRLAPALLLFLAVCFVLAELKAITDVPKYEFVVCLLYLRDIFGRSLSLGHLWSLAIEEQFYLLWPWFMKFVRRERLLEYALCGTALVAIVRMIGIRFALVNYQSGAFYERPWFRFDSILIGCCLALVLLEKTAESTRLVRIVSGVPNVVSWGSLLAWTAFGEQLSHTLYITVQMIFGAFVFSQLIISTRGKAFALFSSGWLRYCGKISYSLYLWQQLFLVVKYPAWGVLRAFPMNFLAPFACAMLSYYLVESPALRLKNKFEPLRTSAHGRS